MKAKPAHEDRSEARKENKKKYNNINVFTKTPVFLS